MVLIGGLPMFDNEKSNSSGMEIPDYAIESLARCLLPKIQQFYESEEGQRIFKEWKEQQSKKK